MSFDEVISRISQSKPEPDTTSGFDSVVRRVALESEGPRPYEFHPVEDAFNLLKWFGQGIQNLPDDTPLTEKLYAAGAPWALAPSGQPFQIPRPVFNVAA